MVISRPADKAAACTELKERIQSRGLRRKSPPRSERSGSPHGRPVSSLFQSRFFTHLLSFRPLSRSLVPRHDCLFDSVHSYENHFDEITLGLNVECALVDLAAQTWHYL